MYPSGKRDSVAARLSKTEKHRRFSLDFYCNLIYYQKDNAVLRFGITKRDLIAVVAHDLCELLLVRTLYAVVTSYYKRLDEY